VKSGKKEKRKDIDDIIHPVVWLKERKKER
jgi:hypothetical protein